MAASVHSDDPAYFGGYTNDDLACAHREGGLTTAELGQLMRNAFATRWADDELRASHLEALDAHLVAAGVA